MFAILPGTVQTTAMNQSVRSVALKAITVLETHVVGMILAPANINGYWSKVRSLTGFVLCLDPTLLVYFSFDFFILVLLSQESDGGVIQ